RAKLHRPRQMRERIRHRDNMIHGRKLGCESGQILELIDFRIDMDRRSRGCDFLARCAVLQAYEEMTRCKERRPIADWRALLARVGRAWRSPGEAHDLSPSREGSISGAKAIDHNWIGAKRARVGRQIGKLESKSAGQAAESDLGGGAAAGKVCD